MANDKKYAQTIFGGIAVVLVAVALMVCTIIATVRFSSWAWHYKPDSPNVEQMLRVQCQQARGEWVNHHDGTHYCTWPK